MPPSRELPDSSSPPPARRRSCRRLAFARAPPPDLGSLPHNVGVGPAPFEIPSSARPASPPPVAPTLHVQTRPHRRGPTKRRRRARTTQRRARYLRSTHPRRLRRTSQCRHLLRTPPDLMAHPPTRGHPTSCACRSPDRAQHFRMAPEKASTDPPSVTPRALPPERTPATSAQSKPASLPGADTARPFGASRAPDFLRASRLIGTRSVPEQETPTEASTSQPQATAPGASSPNVASVAAPAPDTAPGAPIAAPARSSSPPLLAPHGETSRPASTAGASPLQPAASAPRRVGSQCAEHACNRSERRRRRRRARQRTSGPRSARRGLEIRCSRRREPGTERGEAQSAVPRPEAAALSAGGTPERRGRQAP